MTELEFQDAIVKHLIHLATAVKVMTEPHVDHAVMYIRGIESVYPDLVDRLWENLHRRVMMSKPGHGKMVVVYTPYELVYTTEARFRELMNGAGPERLRRSLREALGEEEDEA